MTTTPAMPELPEKVIIDHHVSGYAIRGYTADQMDARYLRGYNDALATLQAQPAASAIAEAIHYPDCWDQMAYPTLESALHELTAWFKCSNDECAQPAEVSDAEIDAVTLEQWGPDAIRAAHRQYARAILALRPQAVPMTEDTELLEFMFQHRAVVSLEFEGGWDAELLDESGSTVSAASGSTPRDALRKLKAHHGITAPQQSTPAQDAVCNNGDCSWGGPLSQCRMLGAIGPLCPECGETVEPCGVTQQATPDSACKVCQGTGDAPLVTKYESLCKACYGTAETLTQATPPKAVVMSDSAEGPGGIARADGRSLTRGEIRRLMDLAPAVGFEVISYQVNDITFGAEARRVDENTVDIGRVAAFADEQATPERHLTVTTNQQGEAVMVSWQDDEHRILEVVWERKQATPEPLTWAPLKRSADGRAAVLKFFMFNLKRHDFLDYITNTLAADFACVLGGYLQAMNTAATPEPVGEVVAYREKLTGRLCEPEDMHRRKFPMCYEPLFTRAAPGVPAINYDELIQAAFAKNRKWAQGTNGCVAFAKGAEWFRDLALAAAQAKGDAA